MNKSMSRPRNMAIRHRPTCLSSALTLTVCTALATAAGATPPGLTGRPHLIGDLDRTPAGASVRNLSKAAGIVFFAGRDDTHGRELWRTDGTADGTRLVADLRPGGSDSEPSRVVEVGRRAFFTADDGTHGRELWRSDGTARGTLRVTDILPGPGAGTSPFYGRSDALAADNTLYFTADDGVHGKELWQSNGTAAGTAMIADIHPGPGGSNPSLIGRVAAGLLLAADHPELGRELWLSDGTAAGTRLVVDFAPGPDDSFPSVFGELDPIGGRMLVATFQQGIGTHLWTTDGTAAGTVAFAPTSGNHSPNLISTWQGVLWFTLGPGWNDSTLYRSDGTAAGTTAIVSGVMARGAGMVVRGVLYFPARATPDDAERGGQLWRTDGTASGTFPIRNLVDTGCSEEFGTLFRLGDELLFAAREETRGWDIWASDGTTMGTRRLHNFGPLNTQLGRTEAVLADGILLFAADDGRHGSELWRTDGSPRGTYLVKDLLHVTANAMNSWPESKVLAHPGGGIVFGDRHGTLWHATGTDTGARRLPSPAPGRALPLAFRADGTLFFHQTQAGSSALWRHDSTAPLATFADTRPSSEAALAGNLIFFVADNKPWRSDGTAAGTYSLAEFDPGLSLSSPSSLLALGNRVLFAAETPGHGRQIWASDGTASGTRRLTSISTARSWIQLFPGGGLAFALVDQGATARSLWSSDGTPAGTRALHHFAPGPNHSLDFSVRVTTSADGALVLAGDPQGGYQLWQSDGTSAGTRLLAQVQEAGAPELSRGSMFAHLGEGVVFSGWDAAHGAGLRRFDTASGRLEWLANARTEWWLEQKPVEWQGRLYFVADDGTHGRELWQSDGTPAGTTMVAEVFPGARGSDVLGTTAAGEQLFFFAANGSTGREPWVIDAKASAITIERVRPSSPLPGSQDCAVLEVEGRLGTASTSSKKVSLAITDHHGFVAETRWQGDDCTVRGDNGALRCSHSGRAGSDRFRAVFGRSDRLGRVSFAATLGTAAVPCTLTPPVRVSLALGDETSTTWAKTWATAAPPTR